MQRPRWHGRTLVRPYRVSQLSGARCHVDARFRGRRAFRRHASLPEVFCQKSDQRVHGRKVGCTNQRRPWQATVISPAWPNRWGAHFGKCWMRGLANRNESKRRPARAHLMWHRTRAKPKPENSGAAPLTGVRPFAIKSTNMDFKSGLRLLSWTISCDMLVFSTLTFRSTIIYIIISKVYKRGR
jgi:hypothetical protein